MEWNELASELNRVLGSGTPDVRYVWSPGRVNLIGDHIDYSGGSVLPMALDVGTRAVVRPRTDGLIRGYSTNFASSGIFEADLENLSFNADHEWFSYVLGVVHTFAEDGMKLSAGFDVCLSGNIPVGSGLSSSASVELVAGVAVNELGQFAQTPKELAVICQRTENDYVGVACGIMDQLAIAEGRSGSALLMDCQTLDIEPVPFPVVDYVTVVANTKHPRSLAGSAYNDRRQAVELALEIVNSARSSTGAEPYANLTRASTADLLENEQELKAAGVLPYARHTVSEQARVISAAKALRRGDVSAFGQLMRWSHESLRDDLRVTGEFLDALAEAAWQAPGVVGARMTGAGFGGCTVNLVRRDQVDVAIEHITRGYRDATGVTAEFFVVEPAVGAGLVQGASLAPNL